jgi:DNA-binding NarL/FixJ family response regulator
MDTRMSIRVLLTDDHPVAREGIRAILERTPDIQIVGEARDGIEAKRMVADLCPDILLLDLVMPGPRPSEIEAWVRTHYPETITLVLTAHDRDAYLADMIEAGAVGFVTKEKALERLVEAIRRAARGEILFGSEQLTRARRWREEVGERWESLTGRERQVLQLLVEGLDNVAIAEALCVTTKTVEYHVTNTLNKLDAASRLEAVVWVRDHWPDGLPGDLQYDLGKSPG